MTGWRAWYADGRVFSSADSEWQDLPAEGMVGVVVYEDPPYRRILDGADWWWLKDGEVRSVRSHPEWGRWAPPPRVECRSCVKRGAAMDDDAFAAVQTSMMEAVECP